MNYTFKMENKRIKARTGDLFYKIDIDAVFWIKTPLQGSKQTENDYHNLIWKIGESEAAKVKYIHDFGLTDYLESADQTELKEVYKGRIGEYHGADGKLKGGTRVFLKTNECVHFFSVEGIVIAAVKRTNRREEMNKAYDLVLSRLTQITHLEEVQLSIHNPPITVHQMVAVDLHNKGIEPAGGKYKVNKYISEPELKTTWEEACND